MKVASKIVLSMLVILMALRLVEGVYTITRETRRLEATLARDAELFSVILSTSINRVWHELGQEEALRLIDTFNIENHPVQISWVANDEGALRERLTEETFTQLQRGNRVSARLHHRDRGEVQYSLIPITAPGANGAIQVAEALEGRSRYVRHALLREIVAGCIIVVVGGGAILLVGYIVIGRPLDRLRRRIEDIGEGHLSKRIRLGGHDELSMLADGLNDMCEKLSESRERESEETAKRLKAMEQMRHMERLTTIGRLAAGVAHELGTPLNVIEGRAGMIVDGTISPQTGKVKEVAETIKTQAARMTGIIQRLLDFARQRPPKGVSANGLDIVRRAVELVDYLGYDAEIRIGSHGESNSFVADMDLGQMQQVMTNLLENALQATPAGGTVTVSLYSGPAEPPAGVESQPGRYLRIVVEDQGIGITPEHLPNVFDPFFTTKDVGKGTGLGLSIAYGIVREHGGWIDVSSEPGKGSCFTVHIPQEDSL